jgi:hypothetical protein
MNTCGFPKKFCVQQEKKNCFSIVSDLPGSSTFSLFQFFPPHFTHSDLGGLGACFGDLNKVMLGLKFVGPRFCCVPRSIS